MNRVWATEPNILRAMRAASAAWPAQHVRATAPVPDSKPDSSAAAPHGWVCSSALPPARWPSPPRRHQALGGVRPGDQ
jgi:CubicO group peptidase (beta-lactamase class C family)